MRSHKLRLKQVALDCGFSSTRQLSVIFERLIGVPLREYAARLLRLLPA